MITDDQLLLYHYRELDTAERAEIAAALAEQPELSQRLTRLIARLAAAAASPEGEVPVQFQHRWKSALDSAAASDAGAATRGKAAVQPRWRATTTWAAAAAIAAVALVIGYQLRAPGVAPSDPMTAANIAEPRESSAYERGLQLHLASTQRQLVSLSEASPEQRAQLVAEIIDQNNRFALAAERAGEPQLARVLRAFTPVLESVAEGRDETPDSGIDQLGFELRVMQARLGSSAET